MTDKHLPVKEETATWGTTLERCPHDKENPYTMISRALIRDNSISFNCRMLIIYLLSNKEGWRINIKQVINYLKPHMGRDSVYKILDEALKAGYMKREDVKTPYEGRGCLKAGIRYFVSETPKFKESLRHPPFQDTDDQDTENTDIKNKLSPKKEHAQEEVSSLKVPEEPPAAAEAAKAAEAKDEDSPKEKRKRVKAEFDSQTREVGQEMLACLSRAKPNYVPPTNLAPFLTHLDYMLRLDKRAPSLVIDVLTWAVADSFWADKMFKPNPAEYLRKQFDSLEMKMNAKPPKKDRKFAPSSNDERSLEKMREWSKTAL